MHSANLSILYSNKEKKLSGYWAPNINSECFLPPLFQTNRISRRIDKSSENLTSLSVFTLNIKQFL